MLDVLAFLAFGAILYYLGRKSAPIPEPVQLPQEVHGPGSVIRYLGKDMVLTQSEYRNVVLGGRFGTGEKAHQRIDIAFVDMETYADTHQIPEEHR